MRSHNDLVILGILRRNPTHAYQIERIVQNHNIRSWARISKPALYKRLKSLEQEGLLTSRKERVGNVPERTVYELTPAGCECLADMVAQGLRSGGFLGQDLIASLPFIEALDRSRAIESLQEHLKQVQENIELLEGKIDRIKLKEFELEIFSENMLHFFKSEAERIKQLIHKIGTTDQWGRSPKGPGFLRQHSPKETPVI